MKEIAIDSLIFKILNKLVEAEISVRTIKYVFRKFEFQ